ncbi:hypothetical protein NDU88_006375 [Pleurodeles waltl]|uniref:Uncharacterized protein n=1 Tax=Pleurodeles waltl TaxID=8319 RepID=A0AAV7LNX5_PLEWA|nr:hypothetical protein NDU88_006375 [Pleurodeles waltl]
MHRSMARIGFRLFLEPKHAATMTVAPAQHQPHGKVGMRGRDAVGLTAFSRPPTLRTGSVPAIFLIDPLI